MRQNEADIQARLDEYELLVGDINERIQTLRMDNPHLADKFTIIENNVLMNGSMHRWAFKNFSQF